MPIDLKKLGKIVVEIQATPAGKEPSMYPSIRNLFVSVLGHDAKHVLTDSRTEAGVRPDVAVAGRMESGLMLPNWIVVEAKDEPVFSFDAAANRIMAGKWRYVTAATEWFVCIDPSSIRIRRISKIETPKQDQPDEVFSFKAGLPDDLVTLLEQMSVRQIGERQRLENFRKGTPGTFGRIAIAGDDARRLFLDSLKSAAKFLSAGVGQAMAAIDEDRQQVRRDWVSFRKQFPSVEIKTAPFKAIGIGSVKVDEKPAFRQNLLLMKEHHRKAPVAFMLETQLWERYRARTEDDKQADALLREETAALLLSRILMLRFFEDYDYFGKRRYLCNGGVAAFQNMRAYFEAQYPEWLRQAYEAGGRIYQAVFDLSPLDWILNSRNSFFSVAIEQAMLTLSVFDFKTIEEELLSAIYGTFFDDRQRKAMGEHYTPPSIARWIVKRVRGKEFGKVLDPACGFGTFLVEGYIEFIAGALKKGIIELPEAEDLTANLCGNDWNYFSGTIAQMQMLWNLLHAPGNHLDRPLPQLNISAGFDSLEPPTLFSELEEMDVTPWSELDNKRYAMVVGNPPYVRPERRVTVPTKAQEEFFSPIGAKSNLYGLFIYKALTQWLDDHGKLGFVIPLTFVDTEDSGRLRELFRVGGQWKILEIVDMEEIKRAVFPSANVRPIILIAQKQPSTRDDKVTLRIADYSCVKKTHEGENLRFDLDAARSSEVPYESIWSHDGRILTRLTTERSELAWRIAKLPNFEGIAYPYWDRMKGSEIVERRLKQAELTEKNRWIEKRFLLRGAVVRKSDASALSGPALYKGENILPCQLVGDPIKNHIKPQLLSDPSVWRFPESIPDVGVAFARISMFPVGVVFDPKKTVFLDTATLFFPKPEFAEVPFDFLVMATAYRWFYAVYVRQGVIADFFCQAYPKAIGTLPWHDSIAKKTKELKSLRSRFLEDCRALAHGKLVLAEKLDRIGVTTLKERVEQSEGMQLHWGEISYLPEEDGAAFLRIAYGDSLFEYVEVNDEGTAQQLSIAVRIFAEKDCTRDNIRALPLPRAGSEAQYDDAISEFEESKPMAQVEALLGELDDLVSPALSISSEEVDFMRRDLSKDGLFSKLTLRLPYQGKTLRGILENLTSSKRYS